MAEKQIVETARLGRKTDKTFNRPLLVSFNNEQDAVELNRILPNVKDATTEIRSLRVNPERSLKKREEVRMMINRAKNLNVQEEGNLMHLVRRMQIIKVKKKCQIRKIDILVHER